MRRLHSLAISPLVPLAFAAALLAAPSPALSQAARRSVLLVTIDTLRADHVGAYGSSAAATPQLDRLAASGVLFEEARAVVPLTLPSHGTILTGALPPRHQLRGNGLFRLADGVPTLAEAFRKAGYRTIGIVASTVLDRSTGISRGFDVYDDNQRIGSKQSFGYIERGATQIFESAERELAKVDGPFFLWVHFYDPHLPWVAPRSLREKFPPGKGGYDAEIAFVDLAFGRLRAVAEERSRGALVVAATADHGESLGEHGENQHGYTLHRGVLRVPLLLAGTGLPSGRKVTTPVSLVDLAPTLAEAAGVAFTPKDGRPLQRFLGEPPAGATLPFWEESLHPLHDSGWAPLRGLYTADWHFVDAPRPELYDRKRDPADTKDLAAKRKEAVVALRRELTTLAGALGDVAEPEETGGDSPESAKRREELASLGYLSGAAAAKRDGPRLDPKDGLPGFRAVESASELLQSGKAAEAAKALEPFLKKDPSNPRLHHQWGKIQTALGDLERAERSARRAVALDPAAGFLRNTLAEVLNARGDQSGAAEQFRIVLSKNPRDAEAVLSLAALEVVRGDFDASEKVLQSGEAAGIRDPDLFDRLGAHALRRKSADEAARFFERALELDPEDPNALLETGRASLRRNDVRGAMERLSRCAGGPRAFECRMELARANVVGPRDFAAARAHLEEARKVAPHDRARKEVDERLAAIASMEK